MNQASARTLMSEMGEYGITHCSHVRVRRRGKGEQYQVTGWSSKDGSLSFDSYEQWQSYRDSRWPKQSMDWSFVVRTEP